ncbi:glycosyltransferase family 4 protein [Pararobbsia silviterrae]|uniref:Glycosyltransferase family 1 protein n=1 Tax=Pararobbsia silviterrae TaxID=1792498 RepID=A0A494XDI6_9BURK|nr:glycosyltransferase family 1 protein [Pararobbsia silviterrae]RKP47731.1 glycosyltransferase family 1 protein [Pararobbsia silviterrae]
MRTIGIDGRNLALPQGTGVATYARNLANTLHDMGWGVSTLYGAPIRSGVPPLLREVQFFDYLGGEQGKKSVRVIAGDAIKEVVRSPFGFRAVDVVQSGIVETRRFADRLPSESAIFNVDNLFNVARRHFKRHGTFLRVSLPTPPDVMHWTYPLPVTVAGAVNIYTIHDLVPLRLPYTTLDNKKYYYRLIKQCLETADHVCTVSERSKTDIVDFFGTPGQKISNTYQSVDASSWATHDRAVAESEVEGIFGLPPQGYFLFFGAIEPKKNVRRLVEAFLSARLDARLVIVGAQAWKADEELKLVHALHKDGAGSRSRISLFDYVPRALLVSLIRAAKAVVFPSLYEGFGLPVVEAMQLGTPTLCSTGGSLPEIAADASLCVDPYDVADIARGLRMLDQDPDLRRQLSEKGIERARDFNSDAYKARLNAMYDRVL